jgi:hypothetical protein
MATGGNTTDFKFIEAEILELAARFVSWRRRDAAAYETAVTDGLDK